MEQVRIFLRTPLFTAKNDRHVPSGAVILEGKVEDRSSGGLVVWVTHYANTDGKNLEGDELRPFLPLSKIDHAHVLDPS